MAESNHRDIDTVILSSAVKALLEGQTEEDVSAAVYNSIIAYEPLEETWVEGKDQWGIRQAKSVMARAKGRAGEILKMREARLQPPVSRDPNGDSNEEIR
tara:strand:+ start:122 stop:421 length:300 start_codon:yes stop_codon:yes gene_type:complete